VCPQATSPGKSRETDWGASRIDGTLKNVMIHRQHISGLCVALMIGALAACPCGLAAERAEPQTTATDSDGSFLTDPNVAPGSGLSLGDGELFVKMMFSLVLVVLLGVAAMYLSKKVLPNVARIQGKEIHVLETTSLGPRKSLHLVEVGSQRLLIGSTNERITMLTHVTDAWLDAAQPQSD
jgi:flagellar biosynthetic protein FliO